MIERIRDVDFRIAMQKSGELSNLSAEHFSWALKSNIPVHDGSRRFYSTFETPLGRVGIFYVRNEDMSHLVSQGLVDVAIIGTDQVQESGLEIQLTQIRTLSDGEWPFVFAYPSDRKVTPAEVDIIATSFPNITKHCLAEYGNNSPHIYVGKGSMEAYPFMKTENGKFIQAIADISVTGKTIEANGLEIWQPELTVFHPVLIANQLATIDPLKKEFFASV